MKIKDLGKAIAEFELNNIPKFILISCHLVLGVIVLGLHFVAKVVVRYWYLYIVATFVVMIENNMLYRRVNAERWREPDMLLGSLAIHYEALYTVGAAIILFIFLLKLARVKF